MKVLYKFEVDCGRMGCLSGIFVRDEDDVKNLLGQEVYFGEVLGKHSEIACEMKPSMFTATSKDQEFIRQFEVLDCETGCNPFKYQTVESRDKEMDGE